MQQVHMRVMEAPSKAHQTAARAIRAEEPSSGAEERGSGRSVLLADFDPQGYSVWRGAEAPQTPGMQLARVQSLFELRPALTLEMVRDEEERLRSIDLGDRCGLLLWHAPRGASAAEAEEITGIPISGVLDSEEKIGRLIAWIARRGKPRRGGWASSPRGASAPLIPRRGWG
jgi:hypothetical protein